MKIKNKLLYEMIATAIGELLSEGFRKQLTRTTGIGNHFEVLYSKALLLMSKGLNLFKPNAQVLIPIGETGQNLVYKMPYDLGKLGIDIQKCVRPEKRRDALNSILFNDSVFTDSDAIALGYDTIFNNDKIHSYNPETNKYAQALAQNTIDYQNAKHNARIEAMRKSDPQFDKKMKMYELVEFLNSTPALSFYQKVKGAYPPSVPINNNNLDIEKFIDKGATKPFEKAEERLMPYFKREPEYEGFMYIKQLCDTISNTDRNTSVAYDGNYLIFNWVSTAVVQNGFININTTGEHLRMNAIRLYGWLKEHIPSLKDPTLRANENNTLVPYTYSDKRGRFIGYPCPIEEWQ